MKIQGIACGIFKKEIEFLKKRGEIDLPFEFLDSSLHIYPQRLKEKLNKKIYKFKEKGFKLLLVYGECHAFMLDTEEDDDIFRTPGINCIEIILGRERYRELRKEGAFIFMPEWLGRWKEIFSTHLGLKGDLAKEMISDIHKKLVYIDTPCYEKNEKLIKEIEDYFDMKVYNEKTDLKNLVNKINNGIRKLNGC